VQDNLPTPAGGPLAGTTNVLVVDDDADLCRLFEVELSRHGFTVRTANHGEEALQILEHADFDVVLSDVGMRGMSGIDLCRQIAAARPSLPVIVVTAHGRLDTAIAAIRAGAYDFITKPIDFDALHLAIERGVQHGRLREEVKRLSAAAGRTPVIDALVGASPAMKQVYDLVERVAPSEASVVITGESGTGKELVAQALHRLGRRRAGPFVAVNCAALPETLLESELFGHTKGAYTDAKTSRSGLFVQASGGTLFLDEIGDMPIALQPKLLRALQDRVVRPVGSNQDVPYDARVVAATHQDLESAVDERRFRADLYFRINVIRIELPPLRSRGTDVLLLAQRFLETIARQAEKPVKGISTAAAEKLLAYPWPGNVRELMNCVERAVALTRFEQITVEDLAERVRDWRPSHVLVASDDPSELVTLDEVERRYIRRVLETAGGNKSVAARILGLDRKTLYRKLARFGTEKAG